MKEAKGRKRWREGGRKRKTERGRIVDAEIKNCVESEKKMEKGGEEVMVERRLGGERGRNDRNEPGENDLLSLGEPSPRRRPFAVFGPRKPSENSGQFFRFWFFTATGGNDEEPHRITACCLFIIRFLQNKTRKCPNV
ncbi:hypothetical protein K0M31_011777 [Melipona bicolor]|uniref:Uncharacterized protein n=1 Tax=Melipona bicolor TaxID=60889 RepID=A0AA40GBF5_9HYME|nr:hypothetical protein K0M31_011777 [Melipona bicolor]